MTGRPDESLNTDLAQRRERGRLAQRAFRQRQIDTIRALTDENQELKDAIERITGAAASNPSAMSDPALQAAIQHARQVAKVDLHADDSVPSTGDHTSDNEVHHSRPAGPSGSSTAHSDTRTLDPSIITGPHHHHFLSESHSSDDTSLEEVIDWQPSPAPTHALLQQAPPLPSQPPISPRLTYGLLFTPASSRASKMTNPPPDIAPYLGSGTQTFSGILFWSALSYAYHAVRAAIRLPSPAPGVCATISNIHLQVVPSHPSEDAQNVFASVLQYTSLGQLHDLLHGRMLFRRQGWVPAEHPAARDPEAWIRLHACILRHEDVDIATWWAPLDIEAYVRSRVVNTGAGFGEPAALIKTLVNKGRCFGDGPRWSASLVREVVDAMNATVWGGEDAGKGVGRSVSFGP